MLSRKLGAGKIADGWGCLHNLFPRPRVPLLGAVHLIFMQILHLYRLPHKGGNIKSFTYLLCSRAEVDSSVDSPSSCSLLPLQGESSGTFRVLHREVQHRARGVTSHCSDLCPGQAHCPTAAAAHSLAEPRVQAVPCYQRRILAPNHPWGGTSASGLDPAWKRGLRGPMESSGSTANSLCVFSGRAAGLRSRLTPGRGWAVSLEVNNAPLVP